MKSYTQSIITDYAITPHKPYGQNFVIKKQLVEEILTSAQIKDDETILEIGGGIGTLTYYLLQETKNVITYEIDPILASVLKKEFYPYNTRLKVISKDFLKEKDIPHGKIVSNLPYSISSPVIWKISKMANPPKTIVLTLQEEFANHLCAKVGSRDYSRLSVFSSYFYDIKKISIFPSNYFYPKPKVSSCLVRGESIIPADMVKEKSFFIFLTALFCRKNKKARNNLLVYQKKLDRQFRPKYRNLLDTLELSQIQPIHLSPYEILTFYIDYRQMMIDNFEVSDFRDFME
ncbi:MAG: 16S rRNA (adenine(1518)-N(6)/adenine(1519)-N(6))-dimethyltransferase RsmA [Candidatus Hodarchaeales archaeon]